MKTFLETIIKNIVEHPEAVVVTEHEDEGRIVFTISVDDSDMGRVIGKEGKVINAIRMVMRVVAIRQDVRVRIDIEDKQRDAQQASSEPKKEVAVIASEEELPENPTPADIVGSGPQK